jgi:hypothetical protein
MYHGVERRLRPYAATLVPYTLRAVVVIAR